MQYVKKLASKTNLDKGYNANHDLKFKLNTINSFDSICLEVSNSKLQMSSKCRLLKLTTASITNMNDENNISVYPNPNKGLFNIKIKKIMQNDFKISLYDLQGKELLILNENEFKKIGSNIELDLRKRLDKGVYSLRIESDEKTIIKKILIEE